MLLRFLATAAVAAMRAWRAVRFLLCARAGKEGALRYEHDGRMYSARCVGVDASRAVVFATRCGTNPHLGPAAREALGPNGTGHHTRPARTSQVLPPLSAGDLELVDTLGRLHRFRPAEPFCADPRGEWDRASPWCTG